MLLQLFHFVLSNVANGKFKVTYVTYIRFYYTVLNIRGTLQSQQDPNPKSIRDRIPICVLLKVPLK